MFTTTNIPRPKEHFEELFNKGVNEFVRENFGGASIYFSSAQGCADRMASRCGPSDKNKEGWLLCKQKASLMLGKCATGHTAARDDRPGDATPEKETAPAKKGSPAQRPNVNGGFNPRDYIRTNGPSLNDIDGLEDAKQVLFKTMIAPFQDNDYREIYKIKAGGGILYYGPPGTENRLSLPRPLKR